MDEESKPFWKRLTELERSPVFRSFLTLKVLICIRRLYAPNPDVREMGIKYLDSLKDPRLLIPVLMDSVSRDYGVNRILKLAEEHPNLPGLIDAVPVLISILKSGQGSEYDRAYIASALGLIGDERCTPILDDIIANTRPQGCANLTLRSRAHHSLRMIAWKKGYDSTQDQEINMMVKGLSYAESLRQEAHDDLAYILSHLRDLQQIGKFEKAFETGIAALKNEYPFGWERSDVRAMVATIKNNIARKKDEIALEKGLLLSERPKSPKPGTIFRAQQMANLR